MELFQQKLFQMLSSSNAFLLDFTSGTISPVVLTFPESIGAGVRSSSVIWCVVCHAGMKRRSRAAERLLYCHMSPVVLAGTADAHCTLIRERGKAQPICHCALRRRLLKLLWRTVSKADSKNQMINNTFFLVGLFLKIISRLTQKEEPVCL